jgi:hypothetical protein
MSIALGYVVNSIVVGRGLKMDTEKLISYFAANYSAASLFNRSMLAPQAASFSSTRS